jgi:hypothetical protein
LGFGAGVQLIVSASHPHTNDDGLFTTRRQLELFFTEYSAPHLLTALGYEWTQLEFYISLTARIVLERDRNRTHFIAARVLNRVSATNAAGTVTVVFFVTTAFVATAMVMTCAMLVTMLVTWTTLLPWTSDGLL